MNLQNFIKSNSLFAILLTLSLSSCGTGRSKYDGTGLDLSQSYERIDSTMSYKSLATLDLDQMNDLVQVKLSAFTKDNNLQFLREGVMIILARPNDDGMVEKILSLVRNPLEEEDQWSSTIAALVRQSVDFLKDREATPTDQVTAGVILENIIGEYKPLYIKQTQTGGFESDIINFIAESNVSYSKPALKERSLYLMRSNFNPSQIAKKIVNNKEKYVEREQKIESTDKEKEKNKKKIMPRELIKFA